jgi:N-carbamoyl-L-amino-acid hydrolase
MTKANPPTVTQSDAEQDATLATLVFADLRACSEDGIGITREAYTARESDALDTVERYAREIGLTATRDAAANLVVTYEGMEPDLPYVACGSHLDSVPQGGNFDGAAGVVAGLAVLASFKRNGLRPHRTVKLFGLRGEESSRFGKAYIGSSALFGQLSARDLATLDSDGDKSLAECLRAVGADVDKISLGEPLLDSTSMLAWLELHIEQGPVLATRGAPVGVVTGIRGNLRHRSVTCSGEAGHSGAIPRWLRRDAVFATAELITHLDRHWRNLLERGRDIVVTCGVLGTNAAEHAIARIPGSLNLSFEVRSQNTETLEAFYDLFCSECQMIGDDRGVTFKFDCRVQSAPASMSPNLIEALCAAAREHGLSDETLPSGAGHDAAVFANAGVPTGMIFVRNEHGSHNPRESMEISDFVAGTAILRSCIRQLIDQPQ